MEFSTFHLHNRGDFQNIGGGGGGGGGGEGPVWDIKTPPMQSDLGSYCLIPLKESLPLHCIRGGFNM